MKVATWNVNGIRPRLPNLCRWLQEVKPTILCLQELRCPTDKFPRAEIEALGYESFVFGQSRVNGVAILSNDPVTSHEMVPLYSDNDKEARLHWIELKSGVKLVNVYVPSGTKVGSDNYRYKLNYFQTLQKWLDKTFSKEEDVILCGDFNVAPKDCDVNNAENNKEVISCSTVERESLEELLKWGFTDTFRLFKQAEKQYSYWDYRGGNFHLNLGFRIDHIYVSPSLISSCNSSFIDRETRKWIRPSDHAPVLATFDSHKINKN